MGRLLDLATSARSETGDTAKKAKKAKKAPLISHNSLISQPRAPENPTSLSAVLTTACQQHGLDPAVVKRELGAAGDWDDPSLTAESVQTYIRCKTQERRNLDALPLADKVRAYGNPWPLVVDGRVVCWLVADDNAKRAHRGPEPVYSASEVDDALLFQGAPADTRALQALRERLDGTVQPVIDDESTDTHQSLPVVRCRDYQHCQSDSTNRAAGLGECPIHQRFGQDEPPPFPNAPRRCRQFRERS